jgi:hypothetical protein
MRRIGLVLLLLPACSLFTDVTRGEKGNARFQYTFCMHECGLEHPMMHGTTEAITVEAAAIPELTITSSAPDVVTVLNANPKPQCCSTTSIGSCRDLVFADKCATNEALKLGIDIAATSPGSAEIILTRNDDGTVFDQVTTTVAEPAVIELSGEKDNKLTMSHGVNLFAEWTIKDANGNELMSTSGVNLSTSDASVVSFKATWISSDTSSIDATATLSTIDPRNPGDAIITATTAGLSTPILVHVN